jgi:hypothetical protein
VEPQYIIDDIAKENEHIILRLLPYHPDLNPIELVWAQLKKMSVLRVIEFGHFSDLQEWYDALSIMITLFTEMFSKSFSQNHF